MNDDDDWDRYCRAGSARSSVVSQTCFGVGGVGGKVEEDCWEEVG